MKTRVTLALMLASSVANPVRADRPVPFLPAAEQPGNVKLLAAGVMLPDAVIEVTPDKTVPAKVIEIAAPNVPSHRYMLVGKVKYENVDQAGFVEMLSHFADGGPYFTRTLNDRPGPLGKILGTHDWRDLALPFECKPDSLPVKLTVNVVLPGQGKLWLSELKLTTYPEMANAADGWWTANHAAWAGALGGSGLGLLGALVGTLCGMGVGSRFTKAICYAVMALGLAALVAGVAAVSTGQPYHVYYPLLLGGCVGTFVFAVCLAAIRRRSEAEELRKMAALDA